MSAEGVQVSGELLWAVVDGPDGTRAVALPDDGSEARRLAAHHGGAFWCSTQAGGCGGRLVPSTGGGVRPSFRHSGNVACALLGPGSDAGRAYDHLRYQRALTAWLSGQGSGPRVGRLRGGGGLHVVVDGAGAALEVQLDPLPDTAWRQRDDVLRRRHRSVTWLYGPAAAPAAATEAAVRGVALAIRRHGAGLTVGVLDVDGGIRWVPLAACRLTSEGVRAPGAEEARTLHARRAADRRAAATRVAHRSVRTSPEAVAMTPLPFPA